ncbi:MAG: 50S ribosomal protein L6 [Candidatus Gracilibacteria bacterium]|nr:50S ribosomal protein L6 [Candidatus Gracilibacteria bacterium]
MSRIGKLPIVLPTGVSVKVDGKNLTVSGPKGELKYTLQDCTTLEQQDNTVTVAIANEENTQERAMWGLTRALVANMVVGVSEGYKKSLEIQGVGYKFEVASPTKIVLAVGFSHKVDLVAPKGITVAMDEKEKNIVHITGIDKQQVGYFAALIRSKKKPEPYKGKGIRYVGEYVRRKAGKTGGKK